MRPRPDRTALRKTRVSDGRISAIATDPSKYPGLEVIRTLFPERHREWVKYASEARRDWKEHHCITGYGFSDNFTDPLTGSEHAYSFSCPKGVVKVVKFDREETLRRKREHQKFLAEQAAKPWVRCFRCNQLKQHFCRSGGCMDCARDRGVPSMGARLTYGPAVAMALHDAGVAGVA